MSPRSAHCGLRWPSGGAYVSSTLLGLEAIRACSRHRSEYAQDAREWLSGVSILPISLDAIHLVTAFSIRDDLGAFFTYDQRLADAARDHDLKVSQPA